MTAEVTVKYDEGRGVWYARPYMGTNRVTGKPWRPQRDFPEATDEASALELARAWIKSISDVDASMPINMLLSRYVDVYGSVNWEENTRRSYTTCVNWVVPVIGGISAAELTPANVEDLYKVLKTEGSKAAGKGLSNSSLNLVHDFLRGFYKWMINNNAVTSNVLDSVTEPESAHGEARALSKASFKKLSEELHARMARQDTDRVAISRRTYAFAAFLSLATGMRCGEVCALALGDTFLESGMVRVRATVVEPPRKPVMRQEKTKGKKSRNVQIGENVCHVIREHIAWQGTFLPDRVADDDSRTLVCTSSGRLIRPTTLSNAFHGMAEELDLPTYVTFHTLRHTHATYLLTHGVDFRTVQERLGHADPATTLRLYAHVMPGRDAQAASEFDEMVGGAS